MVARLTDKQKKEIMADYMESGSYNATAKKFGVSDITVKRICQRDSELLKKVEQKKKKNTLDMLAYMDSRNLKVYEIEGIDKKGYYWSSKESAEAALKEMSE